MTDNNDVITTRDKIELKIAQIEVEREKLYECALAKAKTKSNYDKQIAITHLKLIHGVINVWADENGEEIKVGKLTATSAMKVAPGICFQECLDCEAAEGMYKAVISNLEALRAQLNGLQSINKTFE